MIFMVKILSSSSGRHQINKFHLL